MKKFIVPVLSVCFFISCNSDDTVATETEFAKPVFLPKSITNAGNYSNIYDYAGEFHAEMLQQYLTNYQDTISLNSIVEYVDLIAVDNVAFAAIATPYVPLSSVQIQWVLNNATLPENIVDGNTAMSGLGKDVMSDFIDLFDGLEDLPDNEIRKDIIDFETLVINNALLTTEDKKAILVAASIARYSILETYPRKRSWGSTKSGVVASIAAGNPAEAVTMSVAVNIATD